MTRDPDPRNELGSLPAEYERRCAEAGVVFARLCDSPEQDTPFLLTALRPLSALACEMLVDANNRLAAGGARLPVEPAHGELSHSGILLLQK